MCVPSSSPKPAPPPPAAPAVLEQDAPKRASRDASVEDKKRKGLKKYRSDLTIGSVVDAGVNNAGDGAGVNLV